MPAADWAKILAGAAEGALTGVNQKRELERQSYLDAMQAAQVQSELATNQLNRQLAQKRDARDEAAFETPQQRRAREWEDYRRQNNWTYDTAAQRAAERNARITQSYEEMFPSQQAPVLSPVDMAMDPMAYAGPPLQEDVPLMQRIANAGHQGQLVPDEFGALVPSVTLLTPYQQRLNELAIQQGEQTVQRGDIENASAQENFDWFREQRPWLMRQLEAGTLTAEAQAALQQLETARAKLLDEDITDAARAQAALQAETAARQLRYMTEDPAGADFIPGWMPSPLDEWQAEQARALAQTPRWSYNEMGPVAVASRDADRQIDRLRIDLERDRLEFKKTLANQPGPDITAPQEEAMNDATKLLFKYLENLGQDDAIDKAYLQGIVDVYGPRVGPYHDWLVEAVQRAAKQGPLSSSNSNAEEAEIP